MTNDAVPSSLVSSSLFQSEITGDSNRSAPYQIAVSLREILESRGQTMERIFNRNAPLDQRLIEREEGKGGTNEQSFEDDFNSSYIEDLRPPTVLRPHQPQSNNNFDSAALQRKMTSMRLGFEEEKSSNSFEDRTSSVNTSSHKLDLASLSTSKYDRKKDASYSEANLSPWSQRMQNLSKPIERNCWKTAEPTRSERFLAANRSSSPTPRMKFNDWLKKNEEWKQTKLSREQKLSKSFDEEVASLGKPKLFAKLTTKLAEIARLREIEDIKDSMNVSDKYKNKGIFDITETTVSAASHRRDESQESGPGAPNVFERLALRSGRFSRKRRSRSSNEESFSPTINARSVVLANRRSKSRNASPWRQRSLQSAVEVKDDERTVTDEVMGTTDRAVVRASLEEVLSATSYESRGERRGRSRDRDRDRIDRDWSRSQSRGAATTGEDEKRRIKANLRNRVVEGLTASRTRSLSREKERLQKRNLAERNGSPCERREFKPEIYAPKTIEIMSKKDMSFEERTRRSVEDYLIRVEVFKRLHPTELAMMAGGSNSSTLNSTAASRSNSSYLSRSLSRERRISASHSPVKQERSVLSPRRCALDWLSPATPLALKIDHSVENSGAIGRSRSLSPGGRDGFSFGKERRMLPKSLKVVIPFEKSPVRRYSPSPIKDSVSRNPSTILLSPEEESNRADIFVDSSVIS